MGNEHYLPKGQCVDQCESMQREINVIVGKDHSLIKGKQGEHDKKVERDYEVLSRLVNGFLL
jgi:hypothetical protein